MKDYTNLTAFSDKKLRTLRNNINNRLVSFKGVSVKNLPPSHMLHGMDEGQCKALLERIYKELKARG
jgi:hypothetical protein